MTTDKNATIAPKQHVLNEFIRQSDMYCDNELSDLLQRVQSQVITNTQPENNKETELHTVLNYLVANNFDPTDWALCSIIERTRNWHAFINDKSGEMFNLRVNRTGTVSPLHAHFNQTRKAPSIKEAIQRFVY